MPNVLRPVVDALRGSVRLYGQGVPNGLARITRAERRAPVLIRGGEFTVSTGGFITEDAEPPFGYPLTYRVVSEPTVRHIQSNRVLNPKAKNGTSNWLTGTGRTLAQETAPGMAPPRDAVTSLRTSAYPGGVTYGTRDDRMVAATVPSDFGPGRWYLSGQVHYDSPDLWLWEDVRSAGTWQTVRDVGTWQTVKSRSSELADQPFASLWAAVLAPTKTTAERRRNRMTNPVAGGSSGGWGAYAGASGAVSTALVTGLSGVGLPDGVTTAFRATWTTGSTNGNGLGIFLGSSTAGTHAAPVTPGTVYTGSIYVQVSKAQRVQASVGWYDAAGALLSASLGTVSALPGGAGYTRLSATGTAPAGAAYGRVRAYTPTDGTGTAMASGDTMAATAALLEVDTYLRPYFSGASAAVGPLTYAWAGTANSSESIEYSMDFTVVVAPFQVLGVQAAGGNQWHTFQAWVDAPAGMPAGSRLVFLHGQENREYAVTWWLSTVMVTPEAETVGNPLLPYFDGDTPVPANPAANLVAGHDWMPLANDASIVWNGTDNSSVSIFTGPSSMYAEARVTLGAPSADQLPKVKLPVYLSDPVAPQLGVWFEFVQIGPLSRKDRAELFDVLGRGPQIAVSQLRAWPSGQFILMTRTLDEASIADRLFDSGRILFFRNPDPRFPESSWYLHIGQVDSDRVHPRMAWRPERLWVVPWVRVERPEGLIAASTAVDWAAVKANFTWGELRQLREDWLDVGLTAADT